jgi:hypothetical protein
VRHNAHHQEQIQFRAPDDERCAAFTFISTLRFEIVQNCSDKTGACILNDEVKYKMWIETDEILVRMKTTA